MSNKNRLLKKMFIQFIVKKIYDKDMMWLVSYCPELLKKKVFLILI